MLQARAALGTNRLGFDLAVADMSMNITATLSVGAFKPEGSEHDCISLPTVIGSIAMGGWEEQSSNDVTG